jgi:flagellar M-ring protein FliF
MSELIDELKAKITTKFQELGSKQKLIFLSSIVFSVVFLALVVLWSTKPSYNALYSGLEEKDASKIVEKLRELNIDFQLENGGTRILVPQSELHSLRLEMAKEGLPESSGSGYELFDDVNIGMTEFLQKLNYRRALETELSRTIKSMDEILEARVHIVIPKESLFLEDQKETTASVVIKQKKHQTLSKEQVQGIVFLVASAIEGLRTKNVTIIDQSGVVLNQKRDENSLYAASAGQIEIKKNYEKYLAQKVQSMMNSAVGAGNSMVRVDLELDFSKVDRRVEQYDPEGQVVRSEEVREDEKSQLTQANQPGDQAKKSNTISNYEISRTIENRIGETGSIKRLTVAVMINDRLVKTTTEDGESELNYEKWTQEQLTSFENLVKNAIGFSEQRGDIITVNNVTFDPIVSQEEETPSIWMDVFDNLGSKILIIISVLGSILLVRSIINTIRDTQVRIEKERQKQLEEARQKAEEAKMLTEGEEETGEGKDRLKAILEKSNEMPEELLMRQEIHSRISDYIQEKPVEAVSLLKSWFLQEEE